MARTQSPPQSALSLKGRPIDEDDARWIRQRIGALMSFYFVASDPDIARVQAHQFVQILSDYTRAEIDAAATQYAATVADRAPNPAKIVALIESARAQAAVDEAKSKKWEEEKRQHDEDLARRKQYPTYELSTQIMREKGIQVIKRFGGKGRATTSS